MALSTSHSQPSFSAHRTFPLSEGSKATKVALLHDPDPEVTKLMQKIEGPYDRSLRKAVLENTVTNPTIAPIPSESVSQAA